MKNILIVLTSSLMLFVSMSCNKTTGTKSDQPIAINEKMTAAAYPHEKGFFKSHGTSYLQDKAQCLGCHGKDGTGGTANVSCKQCHEAFPHVSYLGIPDVHGADYAKNPQSCSRCHGDDWSGGKTGVSCLKCHENFPHAKKWANPDQHGKAFIATADKQKCLSCHDATNPNKKSTRCDTCHKAYPHDSKFVVGNKVHENLGKTYEGKCLSCHKDYKENMPNYQDEMEGIGCFGCHSGEVKIKWQDIETPKVEPGSGPNGSLMKKKDRIPTSSTGKFHKKSVIKPVDKTENKK